MNMDSQVLGAMSAPTLYLVLKGEIAIFHDAHARCLRLLAPEVPQHVYSAGPWMSPLRIPKSHRLKLSNVCAGKATPTGCEDFLVRLPNAKPVYDLARFSVEVPLPRKILAGGVQDAHKVHITIKTGDIWEPLPQKLKFTCLSAILVYDWDPKQKEEPRLEDLDNHNLTWPCGGKLGDFRSLHLGASGERDQEEGDTEHARDAFIRAAAVLGVTADIAFNGGGEFSPTMPPEGLAFLETNASYFETLKLGQALGEILQGGRGVIPDIHQTVHLIDGNCGPIGT
jgi:hypothetical protein